MTVSFSWPSECDIYDTRVNLNITCGNHSTLSYDVTVALNKCIIQDQVQIKWRLSNILLHYFWLSKSVVATVNAGFKTVTSIASV